jgi:hypothetical protein
MTTLTDFDSSEIDTIIAETFKAENNLRSIEDAAKKLTQTIYHYFQTDGKSDFVLTRVFQSISYQALPIEIQQLITNKTNTAPDGMSRFLTLLGTYGDETMWQSRQSSQGHQAIPLTKETLETIPMVSRLFQQIGFDLGTKTEDDAHALHMSGVSGLSGIFYVENAEGSPYIPGQDFVKKYGVQSVVGTGVMLPQNEIAAFIGFARVPLSKAKATMLAPIMSKFWRHAFPLLNYGIFS